MMEANWKASLKAVLVSEGGNDDDVDDHGGRTSRGVTQREYNAWRKEKGWMPLDVWKAPQAEIEELYHEEYWKPYCDLLPIGADYMYFDMAVNGGPYWAARLIQRTLGVIEDGRIGPVTRAAIRLATPTRLILEFTKVKKAYYQSLHQPKYIRGWINRCEAVQANALRMVRDGVYVP